MLIQEVSEAQISGNFNKVVVQLVRLYWLETWYSPIFPLHSHSLVCIENHLFILGIGPILNEELKFIFRSDRYVRTCVYS